MKEIPRMFHMNLGVMTKEEQIKVNQTHVTVVGLGGLGGFMAHHLVRLGVEHITLVDFDSFSESNLNRQLFANKETLKKSKVNVLRVELKKINPNINVETYNKKIQDVHNLQTDLLVDCVDNIQTKLYLSTLSKELNVPLLHGSCGGWYGQVGLFKPSSNKLEEFYGTLTEGIEETQLNPVFAPSVVVSYMASEFIKYITGNNRLVEDKLLMIDLFNNQVDIIGGKDND